MACVMAQPLSRFGATMDEINIMRFFDGMSATEECGIEAHVARMRTKLEKFFDVWKQKHGQQPLQEGTLLTGMRDVPFDTAPPYKCAGPNVRGYTELLFQIAGKAQADDLLPWAYIALQMDQESVHSRSYLHEMNMRCLQLKNSLDAPLASQWRTLHDKHLKALRDAKPPVTAEDKKWMLEACIKYGRENPGANLGTIRKHVADIFDRPSSTIATHTRELKKILSQSV